MTMLLLLATLTLSACANLDGLSTRAHSTDAGTLAASRSLATASPAVSPWPAADWWKAWGDPQLDALVDEALQSSPSLRAAQARYERASALAGLAAAARLPSVNADGEATRQRFTANGMIPRPLAGSERTTARLALDFSYELDFWGRNKAALDAALSRARAAEVDRHAARLLLSVAVARTYIELDHQFHRLDVANASLHSRREILAITRGRLHAGLESEVELRQAAAAVPAAQTGIAIAEERIGLTRNQLGTLLGKGPDRGLAIARPRLVAQTVLALPSRLPADLVGRRPEIVAQRWTIEAAAKDIEVARDRFYPNVNLLAFVGFQSLGLSNLFNAGSGIAGFGPAIRLPIFEGGRLRSNLAVRDADYDIAVENYNAAVVNAVRDVADQVTSWRGVQNQQARQREAQADIEKAHALALLRYRAGLTNYLTVLVAESQVLAQHRLEADLRARQLDVSVNLVRALGGGYAPQANAAIPGTQATPQLAAADAPRATR